MSRRLAIFSLFIMLVSLCFSISQVAAAESQPSPLPELIRIHILANSESLADQRIKLAVRDELLAVLNPLLATAKSMAEAEEVIRANWAILTETVAEALEQAGATYRAHLQFGQFNFPAKYYGVKTLPAGRYTALNVTLGEGGGRNWWCIVFPAMCFTAGVCEQVAEPDELASVQLRCKLVEWLEGFLTWCKDKIFS
ncbi:MAG: stage II sporulation protein R [Firmicutes bacterium]|nr:stage II sporulation protein R [Bacillota bacterium]